MCEHVSLKAALHVHWPPRTEPYKQMILFVTDKQILHKFYLLPSLARRTSKHVYIMYV